MLESQDGRRNKYHNLFSVSHRLECSPYCYLGLSEPYVAAHETVHRTGLLHVVLDSPGGRFLVGGVLVHEGRFKFFLEVSVRRECISLRCLSLGIQLYEILGYVLYP